MKPQASSKEIATLENLLKEYEKFFEESISNNEILGKTKIILLEMKRISQEIIDLKRQNGQIENR